MITGITIQNFKGIRERVEIELRPLTLLFGANSAGKSSILHALQYAAEVFLFHNLDAGRTHSGGASVDLGGFRNLIHRRDLDSEVRFCFSMLFNDDLPCSWDPDDENTDPEYVHLNGRAVAAEVKVAIRWSERDQKPFVSEYSVDLNGILFALVKCDAPKRNVRIAKLESNHPVFFDWTPARNRINPSAIDVDPVEFFPNEFTRQEAWRKNFEIRNEDPAFFPNLVIETQRWLLPVGEPGAIGIPDEEDALLGQVREERFSHIRIATKYGEGEQDQGEDEQAFFEMRPKLNYLARILHNLVVGPGQAVRKWLESFRSLGPIRETPPREYQPPKSPDPMRWASGLGAWDRLETGESAFIDSVSQWLGDEDRLNSGYRLRLKRFKELDLSDPLVVQLLTGLAFDNADIGSRLDLSQVPTQSRVLIVPVDGLIELRPSDVGIGLSQVVPVIVTALDGTERFVAIEQPELHIHPRLQAEIADLFLEASQKQRHRFLIETHSEHFILRLQRRVRETTRGKSAEGRTLKSEDVVVYHVSTLEGSTRVRRIDVDRNGEFVQPWPDDFFEIDFYERFGHDR